MLALGGLEPRFWGEGQALAWGGGPGARCVPATAVRVLRNAQRFIDKHLRNLRQDPPSSWPDFPPAAILNLAELPPFDVS
ncbi:hypothetical protein AB0L65_04545 [Nonomuraea sp. NPDC052116]|uniref:hypothetical protein n=1 Tax=Nonomuraea sp. NPDC052116 TaxID=3155665 RepID=UPI00343228C3